jgi:hypothetical protein
LSVAEVTVATNSTIEIYNYLLDELVVRIPDCKEREHESPEVSWAKNQVITQRAPGSGG